MRFKVGDRVRIKSIDWYNNNKDKDGVVLLTTQFFTPEMSQFCGKVVTIEAVSDNSYNVKEDNTKYYWTDEMIECKVEEGTSIKGTSIWPIHWNNIDLSSEIKCPDGYIFKDENGNVINATKIVLEKKKKEYPKTYEECYKIMGVKLSDCYIQGYKSPLLEDLQELLICRDAYWKIAGEEMGLSGSWKPDFASCKSKYAITYYNNVVSRYSEVNYDSTILVFPTEEMRDAFYDNFKELIESCKELL